MSTFLSWHGFACAADRRRPRSPLMARIAFPTFLLGGAGHTSLLGLWIEVLEVLVTVLQEEEVERLFPC